MPAAPSTLHAFQLLEALPDALLVWDADGRIVHGNPALESLLGWPVDAARSQPISALLPDGTATGRRLARAKRPDGASLDVEVDIRPFEDGGLALLRLPSEELTRERTAHHRLREFIHGMNHGVAWEAEPGSLHVTFVGRNVQRLLGYPAERWEKEPAFLLARTHPEDREKLRAALGGASVGGPDASVEHRFTRADGSEAWLHTGARLTAKSADAPAMLHALSVDITPLKRTEARLHEELGRAQAVSNSLAEGVYTLDPSGRLLSMNPAAQQLLGWEEPDFRGGPVHDVLHRQFKDGSGHARDACPLTMVVHSGKTYSAEEAFVHKDGRLVPVGVTAVPLQQDDSITGSVVVFRDITGVLRSQRLADLQQRGAALRAEVGAAVAAEPDVQRMLQRSAEAVVRQLGASLARVWVVPPDGDQLELLASAGLSARRDGQHGRIRVGIMQIGRIAERREPYLTNRLLDDELLEDRAWVEREGMRAFAGYPLLAGEELLGVLVMFSRPPLEPDVLEALGAVAALLAQGLKRRRAEEAYARANARVQRLSESGFIGISVADLDGRVLEANDAYLRMMGRDRAELERGEVRWDRMVLPGQAATVKTALRELRSTGRCAPFEVDQRRGDGRQISVLISAATLPAEGGRMIAVVQDITPQKRTRRQLQLLSRASLELFTTLDDREVLARIANLVVPQFADWCFVDLMGPDGVLEPVAMVHADPEMQARAWASLGQYRVVPNAPSGAAAVLRTGRPILIPRFTEEHIKATAGTEAYAEATRRMVRSYLAVPVLGREKVLGVITWIMGDGRHVFDEADQATAEEMARRVAQAMENARLYREATEAVRLRDEFLSVASHELRTPLTPLLLHVQALERVLRNEPESPARERLVRSAEVAVRQVRRLTGLVESLLDVSRIRTGQMVLERAELDLAALVRDAAARVTPEAERAHAELDVQVDGPVMGLWDAARLDQVVTNLLTNAIKYGAGKPVHVRLQQAGPGRVRLTVQDEGIGIKAEDRERIFQRFERAVSVRSYGGLGLGLYIVHEIVEAHGGSVRVEAAEGPGALFIVELPLGPG